MVWTVQKDIDADPFNLDGQDVRGVASIQLRSNFPYHGKSFVNEKKSELESL